MGAIAGFRWNVSRGIEAIGCGSAKFSGDFSREVAHFFADDSRLHFEILNGEIFVEFFHDFNPCRERIFGAGMPGPHRSGGVGSHPDAEGVVMRKSDVPGVGVIVCRARLAAARVAESAGADTCRRAVDIDILEHIDHNVGTGGF